MPTSKDETLATIRAAIDAAGKEAFAATHGLSVRSVQRLYGGHLIDLRDRLLKQLQSPEPNQ